MASNGVEIAAGQVWRTRCSEEVTVSVNTDGDINAVYPWLLSNCEIVTVDGREWADGTDGDSDLIELVRDEHGFTIWRGGEQPEETNGNQVELRFRIDLRSARGPVDGDFLRWGHVGNGGDIVAYKIVDDALNVSDPDKVAAEVLSGLGWRWNGTTWVQEEQLSLPGVEQPPALDIQVGGDHYKSLRIQPIEYIHANGIPFAEGSVIKYVTRWRAKNGIKDLEKAKHFLELLIQLEERAAEGGAQ